MREACFCGWTGEVADREPTYLGDGDWGLSCPRCGHLDRLAMWPTVVREDLVAEAHRRRSEPGALGMAYDSKLRA